MRGYNIRCKHILKSSYCKLNQLRCIKETHPLTPPGIPGFSVHWWICIQNFWYMPPMGPNSFIFTYIFTKSHLHQRSMPPKMGPHPLWEILDLPVVWAEIVLKFTTQNSILANELALLCTHVYILVSETFKMRKIYIMMMLLALEKMLYQIKDYR